MAIELRKQGFSRDDWASDLNLEHDAVRREDNLVCNEAARIYWRADSEGHIMAIRGLFREEGCL